mgnify:CR=1 FL=1
MREPIKSRRGVYYDLTKSPYEYESPYGDLFKFSSQKKLEIYTRDIEKEIDRMTKVLDRHGLADYLPGEIIQLLYRSTFKCFYRKIEG